MFCKQESQRSKFAKLQSKKSLPLT